MTNPIPGPPGESGYQPPGPPPMGTPGPLPTGPPPRSRGAVITVVVVAVVAVSLAGLAVLGFVTPGFFLDEDSARRSDGGFGDSTAGGGPEATFTAVTDAIRGRDTETLESLACTPATANVDSAIGSVADIRIGDVGGIRQEDTTDTEAVGELTIAGDPFEIMLRADGSAWCWWDIEPTGSGHRAKTPADESPVGDVDPPVGDPTGDPESFLTEFLAAVDAKDVTAIETLSCGEVTGDHHSVEDLLDDRTPNDLEVDTGTLAVTKSTIDGNFTGHEEERGAIDGLVGGREIDGRWCIDTFSWSRSVGG